MVILLCPFFQTILVRCIFAKLIEFDAIAEAKIAADSMVMAAEGGVQEENVDLGDGDGDDKMEELERLKVSEKEKELAGDASTAYNCGDYDGCLIALEKLEVRGLLLNSVFDIILYTFAGDTTK